MLKISIESNYVGAFIMEMIGALTFYSVAVFQSRGKSNLYNSDEVISSFVICLGLATGISLAGNESGAGLNPAISISQNLITFIMTGEISAMKYLLIYILAPLAASYLT